MLCVVISRYMIIKEFKTKNTDSRLIIDKCFFGIGIHLNFIEANFNRERRFLLIIDLMFIRFWWNVFKKN